VEQPRLARWIYSRGGGAPSRRRGATVASFVIIEEFLGTLLRCRCLARGTVLFFIKGPALLLPTTHTFSFFGVELLRVEEVFFFFTSLIVTRGGGNNGNDDDDDDSKFAAFEEGQERRCTHSHCQSEDRCLGFV
jgi:hypothetical protein